MIFQAIKLQASFRDWDELVGPCWDWADTVVESPAGGHINTEMFLSYRHAHHYVQIVPDYTWL